MSKGSNRRPQKISDKEMERKWEKVFPKKKEEENKNVKKINKEN